MEWTCTDCDADNSTCEHFDKAQDKFMSDYKELQKENEQLKNAFGLVQTAANIYKKLYEGKGRE